MNLFNEDTKNEASILTVSELSSALKATIESQFSSVTLRAEISGFKKHTSGHGYFSLKDDMSVLDAVCWRGTLSSLGLQPEDGMEVICKGRITTYGARSKYQIVVTSMTLAGVGSLLKVLQERKEKLLKEGLFSPDTKKALPYLPQKIGIITSETGAVIRDILHRISDRFPRHIVLWPVAVQGENSAREISSAIQGFNQMKDRPDLLIVARGGGSLEDLWSFNEEIVVRAAALSDIPLISAVGHETDTTLIDFAADKRAPTPTAAAEIAVPVLSQIKEALSLTEDRLANAVRNTLNHHRKALEGASRGLLSPKEVIGRQGDKLRSLQTEMNFFLGKLISDGTHRLSFASEKLSQGLSVHLKRLSERTIGMGQLLDSYSHEKTLRRGFSLTKNQDGSLVKSTEDTTNKMSIIFYDGEVKVTKA